MIIGKIYSIRSHQTSDIYIGSTTQQLCRRFTNHKAHYKQWLNGQISYTTSFSILEYDDAYIELIEETEFKSKDELRQREGHYIRNTNCVNKQVAGRSKQEWDKQFYENNKKQIIIKQQHYYTANIEKVKEYKKKYAEKNKETLKIKQQEYYKANKERMDANSKKYRDKIKETL